MDLPLGVIGVAFGTVLLPTFAGLFAKNDLDGARAALAESIRDLLFVMMPAAAGLFALAPEVTRVIYEGHAFDAMATTRVSRALAVYALGLGFFGFQKSMVPWFQAQNDMKTPLRVSVYTVITNATLNVLAVALLPVEWRHVGLAVSTVICAGIGVVLLVCFARRKNGDLGLKGTVPTILKILVASLVMAGALWLGKPYLQTLNVILALGLEIAAGMLIYGVVALALGLRIRRPRRRR